MKSFDETVGLWVVRRSCVVTDSPCSHQLVPHGRSKLASAVGSDCFRDAEGTDPTVCEGIDDRFGGDVFEGDGCGPA